MTTTSETDLDEGTRGRRPIKLLGFGALHAFNTALNMGFTLLQLLVLARILSISRYSEIVFLSTIGFYLQPIDQAIGRSSFVALQGGEADVLQPQRPEIRLVLAAHASLVVAVSLIVPSLLQTVASSVWSEDVLFLFLSLAINMWAFDLQSTAWAIGRNVPFVQVSIAHRLLHLCALATAFWTKSFAAFVAISSLATIFCVVLVWRMFAQAGLLQASARQFDWSGYIGIFRLSFLATLTDFLALNAPYALVAARFGIGPSLIAFDSVMKVARIVMAGARTLAEIVLPRHSALVAGGRLDYARSTFRAVLGLSFCLTLIPAAAIALAGGTLFHILLGRNDVVPQTAMIAAATIVLASGIYQPASFFLGYSNARSSIYTMGVQAFVAMTGFGAALYLLPRSSSWLLTTFAFAFFALAFGAAWLADRTFRLPRLSEIIEPAALANESV